MDPFFWLPDMDLGLILSQESDPESTRIPQPRIFIHSTNLLQIDILIFKVVYSMILDGYET